MMKLRIARHTSAIKPIIEFYTQLPEMVILGEFTGHDSYNGVFIGMKDENWHLEFTESSEMPGHNPDQDDALVFYLPATEIERLTKKLDDSGIKQVKPKNPYWEQHGVMYSDPDGFYIILAAL